MIACLVHCLKYNLLRFFSPLSLKVVEDGHSGEGDKKAEEEVYHCPVCFKDFFCKYGLESHMETHPDNSLR